VRFQQPLLPNVRFSGGVRLPAQRPPPRRVCPLLQLRLPRRRRPGVNLMKPFRPKFTNEA
jgi:hypothetical protein